MADETTVETLIVDAGDRMGKSLTVFQHEIATLRTGRANSALVENLAVEYYGAALPLNQVATISTPDARLIVIQPWDRAGIQAVERAIQKSDLGLTPGNDGTVIRLPIPTLTEERRKDLVKQLKHKQEDSHVAIRHVRRDNLERLRGLEKEKEISEDELRRAQDRLQKVTDEHIAQVDKLRGQKEAELMEV